jgi:glucose-6-phosphate dehydrogenase assembly protein OpcA
MAITYKILGQQAPSATTQTTLYTVGASRSTVVASIAVSNRAASAATFRIALQRSGAALSNEHYLAYDSPIAANDTVIFTIGITLATTDVISVYASTANLSFNAFGSEIS